MFTDVAVPEAGTIVLSLNASGVLVAVVATAKPNRAGAFSDTANHDTI